MPIIPAPADGREGPGVGLVAVTYGYGPNKIWDPMRETSASRSSYERAHVEKKHVQALSNRKAEAMAIPSLELKTMSNSCHAFL